MRPGDKNKGHMDIKAIVTEEQKITCQECGKRFNSKAAISGHVGAGHRMPLADYVEKHFFNGQRPKCPICGKETRYLKGEYGFKKYCNDHANEARKEWSTKNMGFNPGWSKGLTRETSDLVDQRASKIEGHNNPSALSKEQYYQIINKITKEKNKQVLVVYEDYKNNSTKLKTLCLKCNTVSIFSLNQLAQQDSICRTCIPMGSSEEQDMADFIQSLLPDVEVQRNVRGLIGGQLELDVYVPSLQKAFEYNGLYTHSHRASNYHRDKTRNCWKNDIDLTQTFSDEWLNKQDIVKSMIRNKLGVIDNKLGARQCKLIQIDTKKAKGKKEIKSFFDANHIAGTHQAKLPYAWGLYHNNELVCALALRQPAAKVYRDNKWIEISRFATKTNTIVHGGFSKLLTAAREWAIQENWKGILSYADLRFGKGKVYANNGFEFYKETREPNYFYTIDFKSRISRYTYRKKNGIAESVRAEQDNAVAIYDCGSYLYKLDI